MKTLTKIGLALLCSSMLFVACKDDEESKSTADLLTGGSSKAWKQQSETKNGQAVPADSCEADDKMTFTKSGNTLSYDPGAIKCGGSITNGTWSLSNGDKTLTISISGFSFTNEILEASESKAVLKSTETDTDSLGNPVTVTSIVTMVPAN